MSDAERSATISANALEVLILRNPIAGARSGRPEVDRLSSDLSGLGFRVTESDDPDRLADAATQRLAEGTLRAVVAAGGDGTVSLVAHRTPPGTPIAVLPLGTENLFAKYLKISRMASRFAASSRPAKSSGWMQVWPMAGCFC